MIRGTTPRLNFNLPFDTELIKTVWVTFSQFGSEVFTLENDGLEMEESTISVKLTQEQTLSLRRGEAVEIQIRILTNSDDALASNVMKTEVDGLLKEGVIK